MDAAPLSAAITPLNIRSCLISTHGRLVYEHYRNDRTANELAKINSCTKSILSALICIAMDRGVLPGPATPVAQFFPALARDEDARKREITLEHLLTMSAGFNWTEFGGQNSFPNMTRSPHWVQFVLELPLADAPGTRMEYNSGISQLLSAILASAAGTTTARFAESHLFGPLGIADYKWETDPQGIHTGGFGLWMRPADMLKFGRLYLQAGSWEGNTVISSGLAARSVEPVFTSAPPRSGSYAWHWWADTWTSRTNRTDAAVQQSFHYYFARGFGGQFIYVVPALDTVVVLTRDSRKKNQQQDIFREMIAPLLAGSV